MHLFTEKWLGENKMCGISGFIGLKYGKKDYIKEILRQMGEAIRHRGPDNSGIWEDRDTEVALIHRRLSIVDLSPAGHQPMLSPSERYVISFNGEIYNHLEVREDLKNDGFKFNWRGHSDTETLLAAFESWGIEKSLQKVTGMFAFAIWDRQDRIMFLVRDRMGEKPLYYGLCDGTFLFGSELKTLRTFPGFSASIDREALTAYMGHGYIPDPQTIYSGIKKLPPGTWLCINLKDVQKGEIPSPTPYWDIVKLASSSFSSPLSYAHDQDAVSDLEQTLLRAVKGQMMTDVPLGAFLSGGVDSSLIVALMQTQSKWPVQTFSIGFLEQAYNEAHHAKNVAQHLGTDHSELYVSPREAMDVIPLLPKIYDEPFSDSSQIPTFLVAQLARKKVTVSLSGDGGDELFGGYTRYKLGNQIWNKVELVPQIVRRSIFQTISNRARPNNQDFSFYPFYRLLRLAGSTDFDTLYKELIQHWGAISLLENRAEKGNYGGNKTPIIGSTLEHMMISDMMAYLPGDILVKVDRAAMAVSLETRAPFLDHETVSFALRLPQKYKIRGSTSKWILKELLYRYIPRELVDRPKMGFGVPIGDWLRGPLRAWADDLLNPSTLRQDGFFKPDLVRKIWEEHLSGKRDWKYQLWNVLMFQAWHEENRLSLHSVPHFTNMKKAI